VRRAELSIEPGKVLALRRPSTGKQAESTHKLRVAMTILASVSRDIRRDRIRVTGGNVRKWVIVLAAASIGAGCGAETGSTKMGTAAAHATYREVTLPQGTTLRLRLQSAVASDTSRVEDAVRAELRDPVVVNGATVLPAGTEIGGLVTDVERPGRIKGRARVAYRFNSLYYAGDHYDVSTAQLSHQADATKGEDATKIAVGAGAGAAVGAVLGGGSGAAKGAVIGGAAGTGVVLATRGKEIRIRPGASVTTRLTAPVTILVQS
jgi:hypothetical protein